MASGVIAHRVSLAELTDPFVQRKDVQDMMRLVERDLTDEASPDNPGSSPYEQVRIELASGQVIEGPKVTRARGHAERPLTEQQLHDKFVDCLTTGGTAIPAETLFGRLQAMQSITARDLTADQPARCPPIGVPVSEGLTSSIDRPVVAGPNR